jgi:hypothetical protein
MVESLVEKRYIEALRKHIRSKKPFTLFQKKQPTIDECCLITNMIFRRHDKYKEKRSFSARKMQLTPLFDAAGIKIKKKTLKILYRDQKKRPDILHIYFSRKIKPRVTLPDLSGLSLLCKDSASPSLPSADGPVHQRDVATQSGTFRYY